MSEIDAAAGQAEDSVDHTPAAEPDAASAQPPVEPTGVRAADEARARLAELDGLPVEDQVEVYEDLHRGLQEGLADLDER